ncbi:ComE operon protein 1 [Andreesenia angusta]|uniref:ComE operon protein 1 n=1 Tax=Andreesenia angusta TaxID=39480 RepID=A0A1S1V7Z1_9FIRM|nr:helix-hairpin-helix domain-containing protein [Andreesenia angusta]OHW62520.1 ComE operon protein 1 [Andreesenia angusta]
MPSFTKKQQIAILIVGALLIFILSFKALDMEEKAEDTHFREIEFSEKHSSDELSSQGETEEARKDETTEFVVYVKGAVKYPGILVVEEGTRLADVVELAGGPEEGADFNMVNLAKKVQDEEMIHIPYAGEELTTQPLGETEATAGTTSGGNEKVNINKASEEELKSLPGIGEVTARKIVDHRASSPFKAVEDIMDVSGIGEKKFEAIKDNITVN